MNKATIISLDAWYHYILEKIKDIPMEIKYQKIDVIERFNMDEFGDVDNVNVIERIEQKYDYDFYNQTKIELEKMINPCKIIPQEGVRYSIINIIAYCLSELILDYMERYTKNSNSWAPDKKCLIIMKNEFLFKKLLLLKSKKFYASIQELQEGHIIPGGLLDIKGLPMVKKTLNKKTRNTLVKILYEDVMNTECVDQIKVLKDLAIMEDDIFKSLESGSKEYYKPATINSMSSYPNPMTIQGIKASVVWNETRNEDLPIIDLEERNNIDIIKVNINFTNVEKIKDNYPDVYDKLYNLLNQESFEKGGITSIAIPKDADTPIWIKEFIDYETIISDNVKNFPIESLGLYRGLKNNNYTNIISI